MDLKKRKSIFLSNLRKCINFETDLREKFEKQILSMGDDEFSVFLKSIAEVGDKDDLKEKIIQLKQMEKSGHDDFLQRANEFSRKITLYESEKREGDDKSKVDALLSKIKSL